MASAKSKAQTKYTNEDIVRLHWEWSCAGEFDKLCDLFHPTHSVYIDPIYGSFYGQDAIRAWLVPTMKLVGDDYFQEAVGEPVLEGDTYFREWVFGRVEADGTRQGTYGVGVKRFRDGWIVYAADYFDTHPIKQMAANMGVELEDLLRQMAEGRGQAFPGLGGERPQGGLPPGLE